MIVTIITTCVSVILSSLLGYSISAIKNYRQQLRKSRKNEVIQNIALQTLLKDNLTRIYFKHSPNKQIPDYVYQNFTDMLKVYESLDGDGFIHTLAEKMKTWEIIKTDILA